MSWPQDYNISKPDCSIPYVYILLSVVSDNSSYGQLLLLQRQIVLTKTVMLRVLVDKLNATRENSTYCIIISTLSKNWGGFSSPPFVCTFQALSFLEKYPSGLGTVPQRDT